MMNPLTISRGVALLFSLGMRTEVLIDENRNYRPDKVLAEGTNSRIKKEFVNNHISNISPLTCKKGKHYFVMNEMFNSYFRSF